MSGSIRKLVNDEYVLSADTEVDSGKTYYAKTVTPSYKFDVLGNFIDVDEIENKIEGDDNILDWAL